MNVYETALSALRGAGLAADVLCRDGLAPTYAIIRLKQKTPQMSADDTILSYACTIETRIFARSGIVEVAEASETAMLAAGFTPGTRTDTFDGEYQIATMEWLALEE